MAARGISLLPNGGPLDDPAGSLAASDLERAGRLRLPHPEHPWGFWLPARCGEAKRVDLGRLAERWLTGATMPVEATGAQVLAFVAAGLAAVTRAGVYESRAGERVYVFERAHHARVHGRDPARFDRCEVLIGLVRDVTVTHAGRTSEGRLLHRLQRLRCGEFACLAGRRAPHPDGRYTMFTYPQSYAWPPGGWRPHPCTLRSVCPDTAATAEQGTFGGPDQR